MNFEKNYIGKGTETGSFGIIKVTLKMEEVAKHVYTKEGKEYLTFEISKLLKADDYQRTHTAYVQTRVEADVPQKPVTAEEAPAKTYTKKASKKVLTPVPEDNLPF